jgi:hypothetical protein
MKAIKEEQLKLEPRIKTLTGFFDYIEDFTRRKRQDLLQELGPESKTITAKEIANFLETQSDLNMHEIVRGSPIKNIGLKNLNHEEKRERLFKRQEEAKLHIKNSFANNRVKKEIKNCLISYF